MKKIVFLILFVGIFFQAIKYVNVIPWQKKFESAIAEASSGSKPSMVYFRASWCRFCKEFDDTVLLDWTVKSLAKKFVCVQVDADKRKDLVSRFSVNGYPTVLFLNSSGKAVDRGGGVGLGSKASFRKTMRRVLCQIEGQPSDEKPMTVLDLIF